jgi:hypothetical protein
MLRRILCALLEALALTLSRRGLNVLHSKIYCGAAGLNEMNNKSIIMQRSIILLTVTNVAFTTEIVNGNQRFTEIYTDYYSSPPSLQRRSSMTCNRIRTSLPNMSFVVLAFQVCVALKTSTAGGTRLQVFFLRRSPSGAISNSQRYGNAAHSAACTPPATYSSLSCKARQYLYLQLLVC